MRLALSLQPHKRLHGDSARGIIDLACRAEDAGIDGVVIGDHVVLGNRLDRYPFPPRHFDQDAPWFEPLAVLAAVAGATTRLNLATAVLVSPLRPAVLLAKQAATIDVISEGRLELGVGTGWQPEEFEALGVDFSKRGEVLTDGIRACRLLWGASPASFASPSVRFREIWCEPKPARLGGVVVLFSGRLHKRNLDRITELGDGWITNPGQSLDEIIIGVEQIRAAVAARGRDVRALRVRTHWPLTRGAKGVDFERSLEALPALKAAGVTDLTIWSAAICEEAKELPERIAALGRAWATRGDLRKTVN